VGPTDSGDIDKNSDEAWVWLGWPQYLSWFGKTELTLAVSDPIATVKTGLKQLAHNGGRGVLMDEPRNEGSWMRPGPGGHQVLKRSQLVQVLLPLSVSQ
jgi:hypothetical protein